MLTTLAHPTPGYNGARIEMDELGNLWTIGQYPNTAYLIESGVPAFSDVAWLSTDPVAGVVNPGQSQTIEVTIDTTDLEEGVYLASLFVHSNSGRNSTQRIPISLVVTEYRQGVDSGGSAYTDSSDDFWAADQAYRDGGWGYLTKSKTKSTGNEIAGTDDPFVYQSQGISPYGYRFDNVPNGIYQVELRFAELKKKQKIERRLFDVVVEHELVLPAHDIFYEVGDFAANDYVFFIRVADNQMDVRFIDRQGYDEAVINALRVSYRPDR